MKQLVLFTIGVFCSMLIASAQDIITTKEGNDIQAKILEVTSSEIKYKKYNNQEGPTFTMPKSDILIVRYENGENEVFNNAKTTSNYKPNTTEVVVEGMKYKEYKNFYNTKNYVPQPSDPYSRGWAGVGSLLIPGLGQGIAGEWGRGALFLLGDVGLWGVQLAGVSYDSYYGTYEYSGLYYGAFIASVALSIWSICDAVHVAKVKNMYNQDLRRQRASLDFKVEPYFAYTPPGSQHHCNLQLDYQ